MPETRLEVRGLTKHFPIKAGMFRGKTVGYVEAVDKVSFAISAGETLSLVGESGCGKTTMANLILLLHPPTDGEILFRDKPITGLSDRERKEYARHVQVVFQDPYGALNPRMRIGDRHEERCAFTSRTGMAGTFRRSDSAGRWRRAPRRFRPQ